jgi:O-antigen ligase
VSNIFIDIKNIEKILNLLIFVSSINALYGLIQILGLDPITWTNEYNSFVGTFGNPNFASAFLGMGSIAIYARIIESRARSKFGRILYTSLFATFLFVMFSSQSIQGPAICFLGIHIIVFFRQIHSQKKSVKLAFLSFSALFYTVCILGMLQIGPLSKFLYQESITYRGDYWRAGWRMFLNNFFYGVGLDQYGNYYRVFRSAEAVARRSPEIVSSSAHNIFLDMAATGGILHVGSYAALLIIVLINARKLIYKDNVNLNFVVIVAIWVAFLAQSIISVNHMAISLWGWVLAGTIVGISSHSNGIKISKLVNTRQKWKANRLVLIFLFSALGTLISFLPVKKDFEFKSALNSASADRIEKTSLEDPLIFNYLNDAGRILINNGMSNRGEKLIREANRINPSNYEGWLIINEDPNSSSVSKAEAKINLAKLDPRNPRWMKK